MFYNLFVCFSIFYTFNYTSERDGPSATMFNGQLPIPLLPPPLQPGSFAKIIRQLADHFFTLGPLLPTA